MDNGRWVEESGRSAVTKTAHPQPCVAGLVLVVLPDRAGPED
jgi:hypothetical protein